MKNGWVKHDKTLDIVSITSCELIPDTLNLALKKVELVGSWSSWSDWSEVQVGRVGRIGQNLVKLARSSWEVGWKLVTLGQSWSSSSWSENSRIPIETSID